MSSKQLRQTFIDYFCDQKHHHLPSANLIPNDSSLLFVNAGMVPLKPYFLGQKNPKWQRVVSSQRCVRAGGKHNDLENVGVTARHHTFFEMLGNFTFGAYFKQEAIHYAWDFITGVCQIPKEKLWITVYQDDHESAKLWHEQEGVPKERIIFCGADSNFWSMGNTGPCGPCTEIFYDHGPDIAGGPPGSPDEDGDRFVEIWNLVFMEFNQSEDGSRVPLPTPCVDTGMGLERMAAVLQGVHDNYLTDQFQEIIAKVRALPGGTTLRDVTCRVLADHVRSTVFLILDGIKPANEGRGYVLRRIMRRALCFAHRDNLTAPFFFQLAEFVVEQLTEILPQNAMPTAQLVAIVKQEELQFAKIITNGMQYLDQYLQNGQTMVSGADAFKLYDTYGFPLDLTLDLAASQGIAVDEEGFKSCMAQQKKRSKGAQSFKDSQAALPTQEPTAFIGYDNHASTAVIKQLFNQDRQPVSVLDADANGYVVLDQSVFYPEGGGQVADAGTLATATSQFKVKDVKKQIDTIVLSGQVLEGCFQAGQEVDAKLNADKRLATQKNHSATHLLHKALQVVLGSGVAQKGSLVNEQYLRFDFSYHQAMTAEQLTEVQKIVRGYIRANLPVKATYMALDAAKEAGAMALFDDKYQDQVRVLAMGDVSLELCGGTHVAATGEIGSFKIISESSVASGVRRITALTGIGCDQWLDKQDKLLVDLAASLNTSADGVADKITALTDQLKALESEVAMLRLQVSKGQAQSYLEQMEPVKSAQVLTLILEHQQLDDLRTLIDQLRSVVSHNLVVVVLSPQAKGKNILLVAISKNLTHAVTARDVLQQITVLTGGGGGGRPDFAQGACPVCPDLGELKTLVQDFIATKL